jgi:hypothetical protein
MIWLDRVLATPAIGFSFKPELTTEHEVLSSIRPLFDQWTKAGEVKFLKNRQESLLTFETVSGFHYKVRADAAIVEFKYKSEIQTPPGLLPMLPECETKAFSELFEECVERAADFFDRIIGRRRPLVRAGIVAATRIDGETPPPGIALYVKHLQSPWQRPLYRCSSNVLGVLEENDKYRDQCHHELIFDQSVEAHKNDFRLNLDWQRVYLAPNEIKSGNSKQQLKSLSPVALEYFEKFGRGELHYGNSD